MPALSLLAAAKINLYLEILGSRADGYHELAMVMQSVGLCDRIDLRLLGRDAFTITCDHPDIPHDQRNLAYKAAELMAQTFPDAFARYGGVAITIHKHIPVGAGLAGGSTDAAAVLVGIDMLWNLGLTQGELQVLAAQLGSDIPFCVTGGTALATGRGEQLSPLPDLDNAWVVLAKYRSISIGTGWAYQTYRQQFEASYLTTESALVDRHQQVRSGAMVRAISKRDVTTIGQLLYNDFEKIVYPAYPQLQHLRDTFAKFPVLGTLMSGSGSTVFALVASQAEAMQVQAGMRSTIPDADLELWSVPLTNTSIRLVDDE
ncbi:MAG: 4-(cytidine 5'-diphospho)-2-C-methyl-D-erythritol kinase [Cyanobacteria bacterium]|nr:4-(cytidine 5'-diphospho)-2-C-methyl-D-erythritol kinase [Cyanobacteriota bacterium]MDW8203078.1 4-(cytidine 5'-diphospho)-2-C-methyl-D-erythritol kinase [Cyanobacteriota bacterium SKYGB_h_bin112]